MASNITLAAYDPIGSTVTTLHLAGTGTAYPGTGTPWTSQNTSPYVLSMNSTSGPPWTPTAPDPALVLSGTPPFALGASLAFTGYANVTESIGMQVYGTAYGNCVDLLNLLRRVLSAGVTARPVRLTVQPNGSSNVLTFEVVSGKVQEDYRFLNDEANVSPRIMRATLTLVLRPLASLGDTTLNNAASMNNSGISAPTNLLAFGTLQSDLVNEGAPMELDLTFSTAATRIYLASALSRDYVTTPLAGTYTTSSTTGAVTALTGTTGVGSWASFRGARARILVHASVPTNGQFRAEILLSSTSAQPIYTSPWISSTGGVAQLIDCGKFDMTAYRSMHVFPSTASMLLRYRSTDGLSASIVVTSAQFLYYYDFAVVNPTYSNGISIPRLVVGCYDYVTLSTASVLSPRAYSFVVGTNTAIDILDLRGSAPRYYSGCSLFCAYLTGSTGLYTPANTTTATVYGMRQYHTLKGGTL
jgi:hypothetical protein